MDSIFIKFFVCEKFYVLFFSLKVEDGIKKVLK